MRRDEEGCEGRPGRGARGGVGRASLLGEVVEGRRRGSEELRVELRALKDGGQEGIDEVAGVAIV